MAKTFAHRVAKATDDFVAGRSLQAYDHAVLNHLLANVCRSYRLLRRMVLKGLAPASAARKASDDRDHLREVLRRRQAAKENR